MRGTSGRTAETLIRRSRTTTANESRAQAWLGEIFGHTFTRRILVAVACSIALHEIVAGLIPPVLKAPRDEKEVVERVAIIRIARPTPTPTPQPTPKPPHTVALHANTVTPTVAPVIPQPQGKAAHKEAIKHAGAARPKPPHVRQTKPIWDIPMGAQGAGAGRMSGAGSLGNGTNGTGTGNEGNGAGGGGSPCGAVDFLAKGDPTYNDQTHMYERTNVQATIHYAAGSAQTIDLDWTWRYRSKDDDPWENHDAPMLFQFPPASQRASEPDTVQYIMRYSRESGRTKLKDDCPNIPPPPTPGP